jgi:hypothetical protein
LLIKDDSSQYIILFLYQIHDLVNIHTLLDLKIQSFHTSASNEGNSCDVQNIYSSCSLNNLVLPELVSKFLKPPSNASLERCLVFNGTNGTENSTRLIHASCKNDMLPYICEPTCIGPTCPVASECAKNV